MSWSAHFEVNADGTTTEPVLSGITGDEAGAQADVAFDAAMAIIGTKTLGEGYSYRVNLSGHANEGNKPKSGWSNDSLSISINQLGTAHEDG